MSRVCTCLNYVSLFDKLRAQIMLRWMEGYLFKEEQKKSFSIRFGAHSLRIICGGVSFFATFCLHSEMKIPFRFSTWQSAVVFHRFIHLYDRLKGCVDIVKWEKTNLMRFFFALRVFRPIYPAASKQQLRMFSSTFTFRSSKYTHFGHRDQTLTALHLHIPDREQCETEKDCNSLAITAREIIGGKPSESVPGLCRAGAVIRNIA